MRSSCISHPEREPLIILRKWQIEACDGNKCAGLLLSFFEYWHNIKLAQQQKAIEANDIAEAHGDNRVQDETLYQFHTEHQLEEGILGLYKRDKIREALTLLEKKGFISITKNPNPKYKFDKTRYFVFHDQKVSEWLETYKKQNSDKSPVGKNRGSSPKNPAQSLENPAAITKTTPKRSIDKDKDLKDLYHESTFQEDEKQTPNRVTNKDLITELGNKYRNIVPKEKHAKGDYAFIGGLYTEYGYDKVLSALSVLEHRFREGIEIEKPLIYLKAIVNNKNGKRQPAPLEKNGNKEGFDYWDGYQDFLGMLYEDLLKRKEAGEDVGKLVDPRTVPLRLPPDGMKWALELDYQEYLRKEKHLTPLEIWEMRNRATLARQNSGAGHYRGSST